ncbi:uncharacterized protein LAJ45_07330 [Morchella importuna]|uniref:uncharacterized protein n=1 Tax=Morchella importuna TaxID=1174673 RepID=UPI001E8DED7B|nr:uncharacterized protein LAJ45_07330 [Morchella importuna]KAH8148619.1 hypothetical protein LAJ45_07330 [Morchella importuna]
MVTVYASYNQKLAIIHDQSAKGRMIYRNQSSMATKVPRLIRFKFNHEDRFPEDFLTGLTSCIRKVSIWQRQRSRGRVTCVLITTNSIDISYYSQRKL